LLKYRKKGVDARDKRGHDAGEVMRSHWNALSSLARNPALASWMAATSRHDGGTVFRSHLNAQ
jgi:hypothetical protein